jgi:CRISPR-associated protein Csy2
MKSLLILKRVQVQNANAISGLTWGFPAITHFLGFTHALSRFAQSKHAVSFDGCAVICHQHQVLAYQPSGYGEYVFSLSRNPLTQEGKTAPFNEEGRVHLEVSLVIECDFTLNAIDFDTGSASEDKALFEDQIKNKILTMRLAGGMIQDIGQVEFLPLPEITEERDKVFRNRMLKLLPGFMLVDRSGLLAAHFAKLKQQAPEAELIDAWLDFSALKYRAEPQLEEGQAADENTPADWLTDEKPAQGWLVPIMTGYKAISQLYEAGEMANTRDPEARFRFVESVYSVGQWLSPHRIKDIQQIFWHYQHDGDWYLCRNSFQPEVSN